MKNTLKKRIQALIDSGTSQTEIAARAKVSQSTINKIINTETKHTVETCKKFSVAYGWPLIDLINNEEKKEYSTSLDNEAYFVREEIPDDMKRLFDAYQSLSDGEKKAALYLVEGLAKESRTKGGGGSNSVEKKSASS